MGFQKRNMAPTQGNLSCRFQIAFISKGGKGVGEAFGGGSGGGGEGGN